MEIKIKDTYKPLFKKDGSIHKNTVKGIKNMKTDYIQGELKDKLQVIYGEDSVKDKTDKQITDLLNNYLQQVQDSYNYYKNSVAPNIYKIKSTKFKTQDKQIIQDIDVQNINKSLFEFVDVNQ